jgi:O-antigen ligase
VEVGKILSISVVMLYILCLFISKDIKRTYVLGVLYLLPFIDLMITPVRLGAFSVFDVITYFTLLFTAHQITFSTKSISLYAFLFILLLGVLLFGGLFSDYVSNSMLNLLKFLSIFIYAKILINECLEDDSFFESVIKALRFSCIASIIFLFIQVIVGLEFSFATELNPNTEVETGTRYPSFFQDPQKYAQFLAMLSFLFLINLKKEQERQLVNYSMFIAVILSIFLTGGRAALLGLSVGFMVVFLFGEIRYKVIGVLGAAVGYLSLLIFPKYLIVFNREENVDDSYDFRYRIWMEAVEIFTEHPMLGIGIGNYQNYVMKHAQDQYWVLNDVVFYYDHPESGYLKILTEFGIIGFIITVLFILVPITSSVIAYFRRQNNFNVFFLIAAIVSWLISFISVYSISDKRIFIVVVTLVCLLITNRSSKTELYDDGTV